MTKVRAALAAVAVCTAIAFVGAGNAVAHSDQGLLALTAEAAADARVVSLVATLKYANDGDVVPNAVVTASATDGSGASTAPITLADEGEGRYRGELVLPSDGTWDVTVRSDAPVASASASVTVSTRPPSSTTRPAEPAEPADDDDGPNLLVVGVPVVAVAALAGGAYLLLRRRR